MLSWSAQGQTLHLHYFVFLLLGVTDFFYVRLNRSEQYRVGCNISQCAATVLLLYNEEFCDKKISVFSLLMYSLCEYISRLYEWVLL